MNAFVIGFVLGTYFGVIFMGLWFVFFDNWISGKRRISK
jgi:hypothetical protein